MTKKHFVAIANVMRTSKRTFPTATIIEQMAAAYQWSIVVENLAEYFKTINSEFNSDKFFDACTGTGNKNNATTI